MTSRNDRYKQKIDQLERGGDRASFWKPKAGENTIRIIPGYDPIGTGMKDFFKEYKMAYGIGKNNRSIVPRDQFGDPACPYRKYFDILSKKDDPISREEADRIKAKSTVAIWIIDRSNEAIGPQLWSTTPNNLRSLLQYIVDPEYGDITVPVPDADGKGALDIKILMTPKDKSDNGFVKYAITPKRNSSPGASNCCST